MQIMKETDTSSDSHRSSHDANQGKSIANNLPGSGKEQPDNRHEAIVQRKIQQFADESSLVSSQKEFADAISSASHVENNELQQQLPAQAVMSLAAFKLISDFNKWRWSIDRIDDALKFYHKPSTVNKIQALDILLMEIDTYLETKETADPTNERIAPVKTLRTEVLTDLYNRKSGLGQAPAPGYSAAIVHTNTVDTEDNIRLAAKNARYPLLRDDFITLFHASTRKNRFVQLLKFSNNLVPVMEGIATRAEILEGLDALNDLSNAFGNAMVQKYARLATATFAKGAGLRPYQRRVVTELVNLTIDLPELKRLFSVRFDIDEDQITALPAGQRGEDNTLITVPVDWTVPGLKRAYAALDPLPAGHAASNAMFQTMMRYVGGGGWYREAENKVAVSYRDNQLTGRGGDNRTQDDIDNGRGNDAFINKVYFDKVVLHEVGHAVDAKLGVQGSEGYCIGDARGGNWEVFQHDMVAAAKAVFRQSGGMLHTLAQAGTLPNGIINQLAYYILEPGHSTAETRELLRQQLVHYQVWDTYSIQQRIGALNDRALTWAGTDPEIPWKTSGGKDMGGKTFVRYSDKGYGAYDTGARARQVSNYQFRAPQEWFAEAYAAYYMPNANGIGHGDRLLAADPITHNYFAVTVDHVLP
jgi:hypothetical protein